MTLSPFSYHSISKCLVHSPGVKAPGDFYSVLSYYYFYDFYTCFPSDPHAPTIYVF